MSESIKDRLARVLERIEQAAARVGRKSQDITLVAVTKTVPFESVVPSLLAGIRHVGENRPQEAFLKYSADAFKDHQDLPHPSLHLVGQLQRNKAAKSAAFFNLIQSLDRMELAESINSKGAQMNRPVECLVQLKISGEPAKSGLDPAHLAEFLEKIARLPFLRIRGLMGIAPLAPSKDEVRPYFASLRKMFEKTGLSILSMGMCGDFEEAIEEGSTMVRIGSAIFGGRG